MPEPRYTRDTKGLVALLVTLEPMVPRKRALAASGWSEPEFDRVVAGAVADGVVERRDMTEAVVVEDRDPRPPVIDTVAVCLTPLGEERAGVATDEDFHKWWPLRGAWPPKGIYLCLAPGRKTRFRRPDLMREGGRRVDLDRPALSPDLEVRADAEVLGEPAPRRMPLDDLIDLRVLEPHEVVAAETRAEVDRDGRPLPKLTRFLGFDKVWPVEGDWRRALFGNRVIPGAAAYITPGHCPVCRGLDLTPGTVCLVCNRSGVDARLEDVDVPAARRAYNPLDNLKGGTG
jgi:hypothetical protein